MKIKELKLGFPVHNPSICEHENGYLCVATGWNESPERLKYLSKYWKEGVYLPARKNYSFLLNSDFEVISKFQGFLPSVYECSLLNVRNKALIFGNIAVSSKRQMCYAEVNSLTNVSEPKIINYPSDHVEKNWGPFLLNDNVFLIYSVKPFKVIKLTDNGVPEDVSAVDWAFPHEIHGDLHGGTRGIPYNEKEYLSICHSYVRDRLIKSREVRKYKIWAFTFSTELPFKILRFTREPILDGEKLGLSFAIESPWLSKQSKVVFERGLALREEQVIVTYGEQDLCAKISFMDKADLEKLLQPVE